MPYYSIAMILTVHLSLNPILGGLFDISLWSLIMMMVVVLLLLIYQESDSIPCPSGGNKTNNLISHYWTPIIVSSFVYLFVVEHQSLLRIQNQTLTLSSICIFIPPTHPTLVSYLCMHNDEIGWHGVEAQ